MVKLLSVEGMDKVAVSVLTYIGGVSSPLTLVFLLRFSGGICGSSVRQGSSSCRVATSAGLLPGRVVPMEMFFIWRMVLSMGTILLSGRCMSE